MLKQRGLGQSNQKEVTQKGDEHKEEKQSPRAEQQAQQAERSVALSVSVTWLTASWPGGYFDGSAAVSTDRLCGDPIVRSCHVVSNRPVVLNRHVVPNTPLQHPHPSASLWGPASSLKAWTFVVVPGRSSLVPCLSLGLLQTILVQFELIAMSFVDRAHGGRYSRQGGRLKGGRLTENKIKCL